MILTCIRKINVSLSPVEKGILRRSENQKYAIKNWEYYESMTSLRDALYTKSKLFPNISPEI
jgi:hypothetical protein